MKIQNTIRSANELEQRQLTSDVKKRGRERFVSAIDSMTMSAPTRE